MRSSALRSKGADSSVNSAPDGPEDAPSNPPRDVAERRVGQHRLDVRTKRVGDGGEVGRNRRGDEVAGTGVDRADQAGAPGRLRVQRMCRFDVGADHSLDELGHQRLAT